MSILSAESSRELEPERVALAGLLRACEPPSAALVRYVQVHGPEAAWQAVLARRATRAVLSLPMIWAPVRRATAGASSR